MTDDLHLSAELHKQKESLRVRPCLLSVSLTTIISITIMNTIIVLLLYVYMIIYIYIHIYIYIYIYVYIHTYIHKIYTTCVLYIYIYIYTHIHMLIIYIYIYIYMRVNKTCLHFSMCACHPCAGALLIFSASFQVQRMIPEGNPTRSRFLPSTIRQNLRNRGSQAAREARGSIFRRGCSSTRSVCLGSPACALTSTHLWV